MNIIQDLRNLIENNMEIFDDEAVFKDDDNIFKLGFVNSMFAMKIINFIENSYNIKVEDAELDIKNFNSVNNIASFVNNKLNK
jgi:methoxymalonate biosynthesis acyl carrier protein